MALLLRGLRGEPVKKLQEKLGVAADGIFGPGTEKALEAYQKEHGLKADGIAGPDTFAAMELYDLIILERGSRGQTVEKLQRKLSLDTDGKFGPGTDKAVRAFQQQNGLAVDGIVGPRTLAKLDLFSSPVLEAMAQKGAELWASLKTTDDGDAKAKAEAEAALARVKGFFKS